MTMARTATKPSRSRHLARLRRFIESVDPRQKLADAQRELAGLREKVAAKDKEIDELNAKIRQIDSFNLSRRRIGHFVPFILLNTMPKSGSIYILMTLADSLSIEVSLEGAAHGFFPDYYLIPAKLAQLKAGRIVRQEHFDAKPLNIRLLANYTDRIVLHLRDPRQATLSWLHHANRLAREHPEGVNYTVHALPEGYLDWPLPQQLDWQIETHLVSLVSWLKDWQSYLDGEAADIQVLVTRFEDLIVDERAYFARILKFYGIPEELFTHRPAEKTIIHNYRAGQPDEWRRVFTGAQKKRCAEIIGDGLLERFGWEPGD